MLRMSHSYRRNGEIVGFQTHSVDPKTARDRCKAAGRVRRRARKLAAEATKLETELGPAVFAELATEETE